MYKLPLGEILERYLEHLAYNNKSTYGEFEKKRSRKGVIICKSEKNCLINRLENLIGEDTDDKVKEAGNVLQEYYDRAIERYEKKLNRRIRTG